MRRTIEESPRIDVAELADSEGCRRALEGDGGPAEVTLSCRDVSGRQEFLVRLLVQKGAAQLISLSDRASEKELGCVVPIELAPGGIAFFRCPGDSCGRRVCHLYLVEGRFRCRHCHRLLYRCQLWDWVPHRDQDGLGDAEGEASDQDPWAAAEETELARRLREEAEEAQERERQRRRRYVVRTGRPGRPKEKRNYRHDGSRKIKLGPREAYCCRCRKAVRYRYPRRTEVCPRFDEITEDIEVRVAIRARCRICNTPVFRIVRAEEAEGLQEYWG